MANFSLFFCFITVITNKLTNVFKKELKQTVTFLRSINVLDLKSSNATKEQPTKVGRNALKRPAGR